MNPGAGNKATLRQGEGERLKRRVILLGGSKLDSRQRAALLYRLVDRYGRRLYPASFCHTLVGTDGCSTGECCQCRPDIFHLEKERLDALPKQWPNGGYCPFFDHVGKGCSIYADRPFACRLYFNVARSRFSCLNPADETLMLFDNLKRHLEPILGAYLGGYLPAETPDRQQLPLEPRKSQK